MSFMASEINGHSFIIFIQQFASKLESCIAGPLSGESTGDMWILLTKGSNTGFAFHHDINQGELIIWPHEHKYQPNACIFYVTYIYPYGLFEHPYLRCHMT